jgi:hypothetical protein
VDGDGGDSDEAYGPASVRVPKEGIGVDESREDDVEREVREARRPVTRLAL